MLTYRWTGKIFMRSNKIIAFTIIHPGRFPFFTFVTFFPYSMAIPNFRKYLAYYIPLITGSRCDSLHEGIDNSGAQFDVAWPKMRRSRSRQNPRNNFPGFVVGCRDAYSLPLHTNYYLLVYYLCIFVTRICDIEFIL